MLQTFKKIGLAMLFIALTLTIAQAGKPKKAHAKKHICTEACHTAGKCVKAHGEQGHTCGAECAKM